MRVSCTQLDLYRLCPPKYKFYKGKAPQDPKRTAHLRFGTAVHKALEFAYAKRFKAPSIERVLAFYERLAKEEQDADVKAMFKNGGPAIRSYFEKNDPKNLHVLEVERKFTMALDERHEIVGVSVSVRPAIDADHDIAYD